MDNENELPEIPLTPKAQQRALNRLAKKIQEQDNWIRSVMETVLPPSYKVFFERKDRHAVKKLLIEFLISIETASTTDGKTLSIIYQEAIKPGESREILGQHQF